MSPEAGGTPDPFAVSPGFDLEREILALAGAYGLRLEPEAVAALAGHARDVRTADPTLHLTSIDRPRPFLERHLGEAFQGAAMLEPQAQGDLLDLGSGNGYPGLPLAAARPGLRPVLVEASRRKSEFLRRQVCLRFPQGRVVCAHVQRASDLECLGPFRVVSTRALGGWERILPRLVPALSERGEMLLWAGAGVEAVIRRSSWRRLRLIERKSLAGRRHSWIWRFAAAN